MDRQVPAVFTHPQFGCTLSFERQFQAFGSDHFRNVSDSQSRGRTVALHARLSVGTSGKKDVGDLPGGQGERSGYLSRLKFNAEFDFGIGCLNLNDAYAGLHSGNRDALAGDGAFGLIVDPQHAVWLINRDVHVHRRLQIDLKSLRLRSQIERQRPGLKSGKADQHGMVTSWDLCLRLRLSNLPIVNEDFCTNRCGFNVDALHRYLFCGGTVHKDDPAQSESSKNKKAPENDSLKCSVVPTVRGFHE